MMIRWYGMVEVQMSLEQHRGPIRSTPRGSAISKNMIGHNARYSASVHTEVFERIIRRCCVDIM